MKACPRCGADRSARDYCKPCEKAINRAWYLAHREEAKAASAAYTRRRKAEDPEGWRAYCRKAAHRYRSQHREVAQASHRRKTYGLEPEQVDAMLDAQGHACAICATPFTKQPHIDHDHATGQVRALLCGPCNTMLGMAHDEPDRLLAARDYLLRHRSLE